MILRHYLSNSSEPVDFADITTIVRQLGTAPGNMGTYGWLGLATYIALWDWLASETLSRAWWKAVEHPRNRWLTIALWAWITAHLFLKRPAKVLYWV